MSLLGLTQVSFHHILGKPLFEGVSLSINPGDRVAITGPNGAGKSTLLRILGGVLVPGSGSIQRRNGLVVSSLDQRVEASGTLLDFVLGDLRALREKLCHLESRLAFTDEACAYSEAVNDYAEAGGYEAEADASRTLLGLGFNESELDLPMNSLSGGQRTRAALAKALTRPAGLLVLDEPTNHLDWESREWLERSLNERGAASVLASHDRAFLRAFATRVVEIERGKVRVFEGGYDEYRSRRGLLEEQAWAEYRSFQRRKAAYEVAAERRDRLAARVAEAPEGVRNGNDFYARKAAKVGRAGRLLRERASFEGEVEKPWEETRLQGLTFDDVPPGPAYPLVASRLSKRYGTRTLFAGLDLFVGRRERVVIGGRNGSGKTTLFRIAAGIEPADQGHVTIGSNVRLGYFRQDADDLDDARSPLEICGTDTKARTLLGCLKLPAERLNSPVGELSGGERIKVALASILLSRANLLLLDEPTNHLEVEAQEALEAALRSYPGAIVLISHDRAFVESLGEDVRTLTLERYRETD